MFLDIDVKGKLVKYSNKPKYKYFMNTIIILNMLIYMYMTYFKSGIQIILYIFIILKVKM